MIEGGNYRRSKGNDAGALSVSRRRLLAGMAAGVAGVIPIAGSSSEFAQATPTSASTDQPTDLLPSWNDGTSRQAILDFLDAVVDPAGASYVPPEDRIAAFDVDGTL